MNTVAILLWIAGGVLLAVWIGVACYLGFRGHSAVRRAELNTKREVIYRKFGKEPPPPIGRFHFVWIFLKGTPMLLMFSLLGIVSFIFYMPYTVWCFITSKKPVGGPPDL